MAPDNKPVACFVIAKTYYMQNTGKVSRMAKIRKMKTHIYCIFEKLRTFRQSILTMETDFNNN